jgi:hypothetical protein
MLPVAGPQTHLASTSGHAGDELSFRKVERFNPKSNPMLVAVSANDYSFLDSSPTTYWYLTHTTSGILVRKMLA